MEAHLITATDAYAAPPVDLDAKLVVDPSSSTKAARRTKVALTWQSKAVGRDLSPHLRSLTYVDNLSDAADDLTIELEDRDGLWAGDWQPQKGDVAIARVEYTDPWFGSSPVGSLRLGKFSHDKITLHGPPSIVSLQCMSAALSTGLRKRKRTRVWQGVTLKQIAQDIADRASMQLDFSNSAGGSYKRAIQNDKSDLEFLQELCKEVGRTLKVTEDTLVIYDELKVDQAASSGTIDLKGGHVLGWSFDVDESERYGSCHVSCFNPATGKTAKYQYPPDGVKVDGLDPNGQTLEMVLNVSDVGEAQARAQKLLRAANRFANTGRIVTVGSPGLVAGVTFDLKGAHNVDGKFIVTRAEHSVVGGYTVSLNVRRCMEAF